MRLPFIIYALPRSRTFWLSRFLSYGGWHCGHEELRHLRTLDDAKAWFSQPVTGTAETGAAPWWRLVQSVRPDIRTVVVRRPVSEVVDSLVRLGFERSAMEAGMRRLDAKLDQIEARVPGVLSVRFSDLVDEATCARVFAHCLPFKHDPAWWARLAPLNLQIDMPALVRYWNANQAALAKLAAQARQRVLAEMTRHPVVEPNGMTFQQEPFETWLRDARELFESHLVTVGESPDDWRKKNIPLMRKLEELGYMQITTARCNGRMFGYLMSVIGPSLESEDTTSAMHMTFFASQDAPGIGIKLQRASIAALKARGVDEVLLRAGPRGSGPKMGALYRRLGAEDYGQLYLLDTREVA
ncbi:MAG: hypothetical protein P4L83_02490 [Nevskia sp.]|nr:hypothetical protein [Nevskia sp.]